MKRAVVNALDRIASAAGLCVLTSWERNEYCRRNTEYPMFVYAGHTIPHYLHHFNCGHYPPIATERTIELALADIWLSACPRESIVEVGAVTPYYWPSRVGRIIDPADNHWQVTDRLLMSDVDLTGKFVLAISTIEHIGTADYGMPRNPHLLDEAVQQLQRQTAACLVTVPIGYNPDMDDMLFGKSLLDAFSVRFFVRSLESFGWVETFDPTVARRGYGKGFADSIAILEKGDILADCLRGRLKRSVPHETDCKEGQS